MTSENTPSEIVDSKTSPYPYVISSTKLAVLSVTTLGVYEIYWFYKQFKSFKAESNWNINPWLRSFFASIMSYSLFHKIYGLTAEYDQKWTINPTGLWCLYFFLNILWKLPDPYWLLSILSFIPLIQVQNSINIYWKKKHGDNIVQSKFGGWNYVWSILGGIFLILVLLGSFLPE